MNTQQTPLGHNNPPSPIEETQSRLKEQYEPLLFTARTLIGKAKDLLPSKIEDDETSGQFSDLSKELAGHIKALDSTRTGEVEPHLAQQRTINSFFNLPIETLKTTRTALDKSVQSHLQQKFLQKQRDDAAEAVRKKAESEALVETATKLEEAGLNNAAENTFVKAQVANNQALQQEAKAAQLKPADARTRGQSSLATLTHKWKGQVTDYGLIDLELLRPYLPQDAIDKALNKYVLNGGRNLRGASIYQDATVSTR